MMAMQYVTFRVRAIVLLVAFLAGTWATAESNFPYLGTDISKSNIPLDQILSVGPPPQGVPALGFPGDRTGFTKETAQPKFVAFAEARLAADEPVIVYQGKAYPIRILLWHEIVNDGMVAITYSPVSNSVGVFDRRIPLTEAQQTAVMALNPKAKVVQLDAGFRTTYKAQTGQDAAASGLEVAYGTSGMLYKSNLLMFDSATGSVFSQVLAEGNVGTLTGVKLLRYPAQVVSAAEFARAFPSGQVLSRETGFNRPYDQNPYFGYDQTDIPVFLYGPKDNRLPTKERVVALELGREVVAYPFSGLATKRVVNEKVNGVDIVVWWAPGTRSVLDAATIAGAKDVGAVGVFRRDLEGRVLTFRLENNIWVDRETGSQWNLLGQAVEGPLKGKRLEAVAHDNTLWFAWAALRPATQIR